MDKQELDKILADHAEWLLSDGAEGSRANLNGASLNGASLNGANLNGANLDGANLDGANLNGANLNGANLNGANLYGANLDGANLNGASLDPIKQDLFLVLTEAKTELAGLYAALTAGKIDGAVYEGDCCCLVGTIAKCRHENYKQLSINIKPDASRAAEKWFTGIGRGDTPNNNQVARITKGWIKEFARDNGVELAA